MEALIAWALVGLLLVFASAPWWVFWYAERINRRHEEEYQSSREAVNEAFRKQWAEKEAERLRRKFGKQVNRKNNRTILITEENKNGS